MTNEEIIKANLSITDSLKALFRLNDIYLLLDAAREDEAKGFVKWLGGNYDLSDFVSGRIYEGEAAPIGISELYQLYKKQNP